MEMTNKYKLTEKKLGTGGFSEVFLGYVIDTGEEVAIKKINVNERSKDANKIKAEVDLLRQLSHQNIVLFYDVIFSEQWCIVMEYCNAGTLDNVIKYHILVTKLQNINFNREYNTYYYLNQLKDALNYIRNAGHMHRDIKPINVLLKCKSNFEVNENSNYNHTSGLIVKLADFGLARSSSDNVMMQTICGSPLYMAPEILLNKEYDSKTDLWSFGVMMYQMIFGVHPYHATNLKDLTNKLKSDPIKFRIWNNFSDECFNLIMALLNKDPKTRISWDEFFNHKWFSRWKDANDTDLLRNGTQKRCFQDYFSKNNKNKSIETSKDSISSEGVPKRSDGVPKRSDGVPKGSDGVPKGSREISEGIPKGSREIFEGPGSPNYPLGYSNLSRMKTSILNKYPSTYPSTNKMNEISRGSDALIRSLSCPQSLINSSFMVKSNTNSFNDSKSDSQIGLQRSIDISKCVIQEYETPNSLPKSKPIDIRRSIK